MDYVGGLASSWVLSANCNFLVGERNGLRWCLSLGFFLQIAIFWTVYRMDYVGGLASSWTLSANCNFLDGERDELRWGENLYLSLLGFFLQIAIFWTVNGMDYVEIAWIKNCTTT
ncbi:uncharacterized protein LOC143218864 [Lasioglossum baleicum]|uniref:uncharacterized protein LOC143218864 n=1 Tax=Lasioglossum baleicum TaxID=434251 RepID=UPI003FCDA582